MDVPHTPALLALSAVCGLIALVVDGKAPLPQVGGWGTWLGNLVSGWRSPTTAQQIETRLNWHLAQIVDLRSRAKLLRERHEAEAAALKACQGGA